MTEAQIKAGASQKPVSSLRVGENFKSAEDAVAYEARNKAEFDQYKDLLLRTANNGTPEDKKELDRLSRSLSKHAQEVYGARSESGRTMRSLQFKIDGEWVSVPERGIKTALEMGVPQEQVADLMRTAGNDPDAWMMALRKFESDTMTTGEKVRSYFTGNILSSPMTSIRNIVGNATNVALKPLTNPLAALLDKARTKPGDARSVTLEVSEQLKAIPKGLREGGRAMADILRKGYSLEDVTQASQFDMPRKEFAGGAANPYNLIGRVLEGTDLLFRRVAEEMDYAGAAKTRGVNLARGIDEAKLASLGDLREQAVKASARATYQEAPGPLTNLILGAKKAHPVLHYVATFVKTPGNLIKQGLEFTPAGFAMAGADAEKSGARAAREVQARALAGTTATLPLWLLAASGRLSGAGPSDPAEKARLYESGWRPNAVKIGDTWVSYQPMQPLAIPMSAVANAYEQWQKSSGDEKDLPSVVVGAALASGKSVVQQSYLAGVNALQEAIQDPDRALPAFMQRTVQGFVPLSGALRSATQVMDPVIRRSENWMEGVKSGIPGLSESVHPRLDRFGQPVERPGSAVSRSVNPFAPSPVRRDAVAEAMHAAGVDTVPAQPAKTVRVGRETVELGPDDAFALGQARGQALYAVLKPLIESDGFKRLPAEQQELVIRRLQAQARERVSTLAARDVRRQVPLTLEALLSGLRAR